MKNTIIKIVEGDKSTSLTHNKATLENILMTKNSLDLLMEMCRKNLLLTSLHDSESHLLGQKYF